MRWSESKKNRVAYVVFAALICLIAVALVRAVYIWSQPKADGDIRVQLKTNGVTSETIEFEGLQMLPGQSREYTLTVEASEAGLYELNFDFIGDGETVLVKYVSVALYCGEENVKELALQDALQGEPLTITKWIETSEPIDLTIRYTMKEDAKNDAQGTTADFEVKLTAQSV